MNKMLNSVIYVVCSTIFLTLCTIAIFLGLYILAAKLFSGLFAGADSSVLIPITIFIFVASLLGGLFIFNAVLKLVIKKFDIEKYLLERKQKPKKPSQGTF